MWGDGKVLCLAGNEEVVEAARRSEPLYPHKHSPNSEINNRDERLSTLEALIFSAGLLKWGKKTVETAEKRLHNPTVSICSVGKFSVRVWLWALISHLISSHLIPCFIRCCDFASSQSRISRQQKVAHTHLESELTKVLPACEDISETHTHQNLGLLFSL